MYTTVVKSHEIYLEYTCFNTAWAKPVTVIFWLLIDSSTFPIEESEVQILCSI